MPGPYIYIYVHDTDAEGIMASAAEGTRDDEEASRKQAREQTRGTTLDCHFPQCNGWD